MRLTIVFYIKYKGTSPDRVASSVRVHSHIERDVWTKLAFFPAKIMQTPGVLREIYTYMNPQYGEAPHDLVAAQQTFQYLTACN